MAGEAKMTKVVWEKHIEDYLAYRRSLGFGLIADEVRLRDFAAFAARSNLECLTVDSAAQWARESKGQEPRTWAGRLSDLRSFAIYLKARRVDLEVEIPPVNYFGVRHRRRAPHIYTNVEVRSILRESKNLMPENGLRPVTCEAIFGLMAATGMRISEVLKLTRSDFDAASCVLRIRDAKCHKERLIPVHHTVAKVLKEYGQFRDGYAGSGANEQFFLFDGGKIPTCRNLLYALRAVCNKLGLRPNGDYKQHRLHDFRHTYIVNAVLRGHQHGTDADHMISMLSTYVGHAKVTDTYWYITGNPALLSIAAERFRVFATEDLK
jgi:integrase